jgi:hypothetical protein
LNQPSGWTPPLPVTMEESGGGTPRANQAEEHCDANVRSSSVAVFTELPPPRRVGVRGVQLRRPNPNHPPQPRCGCHRPQATTASVASAVSPFAEWSVNKAYHLPNTRDSYPIVGEIISGNLSAQTRSEVGLDEFNYQVRLALVPSKDYLDELKDVLKMWAISNPRTLVYHLFHESLHSILGEHFPWAVFGRVKTLASGAKHEPW